MNCFTDERRFQDDGPHIGMPRPKPRYGVDTVLYSADGDFNCSRCEYRFAHETRCYMEQCPLYAELIRSGRVPYADALLRMASGTGSKDFVNRVRYIIQDQNKTEIIFCSPEHRNRFGGLRKNGVLYPGSPAAFTASLYLLTASCRLWNGIKPAVFAGEIDFSSFGLGKLAYGGRHDYTLYKMAKEIYTGKAGIALSELCDRDIIGDKTFRLIVNALMIYRYGLNVVRF